MLEGKVPPEVVEQWKQDLGVKTLYTYPFIKDPNEILFRPLNRKELMQCREIIRRGNLENKDSQQEVNDYVFDRCVLWPTFTPEQRVVLPVGWIWRLGKVIFEKSGLVDMDIYGNVLGPDRHSVLIHDVSGWGDCTGEELNAIVEKYENKCSVTRQRIGKWIFFTRPITRLDITAARSSEDSDLSLLSHVTIWPKSVDWDNIPAGIIDKLLHMANASSGWDEETEATEI